MKRVSAYLLVIGMILVNGSTAVARLGDSEAKLEERFGKPVKNQKVKELQFEQRTYQNHDLIIGVTLIEGKSASEQYLRTAGKKDDSGNPVILPIPEKLALAILKANAGDGEWKELSGEPGKRKFLRSDQEALALFFEAGGVIQEIRVSSSEFNRHLSAFSR
ncbi:MAG: hypothetical protein AAF558_01125 [Verrucomicrobiota bacterium]